jgi:hypothetical protein
MSDADTALFGEVDARCLNCDRGMNRIRTEAANPIGVLHRVECPAGHTGTVEVRHDGSAAAQKGTLYHGAAAEEGVGE